jgi:hypothetical protein
MKTLKRGLTLLMASCTDRTCSALYFSSSSSSSSKPVAGCDAMKMNMKINMKIKMKIDKREKQGRNSK